MLNLINESPALPIQDNNFIVQHANIPATIDYTIFDSGAERKRYTVLIEITGLFVFGNLIIDGQIYKIDYREEERPDILAVGDSDQFLLRLVNLLENNPYLNYKYNFEASEKQLYIFAKELGPVFNPSSLVLPFGMTKIREELGATGVAAEYVNNYNAQLDLYADIDRKLEFGTSENRLGLIQVGTLKKPYAGETTIRFDVSEFLKAYLKYPIPFSNNHQLFEESTIAFSARITDNYVQNNIERKIPVADITNKWLMNSTGDILKPNTVKTNKILSDVNNKLITLNSQDYLGILFQKSSADISNLIRNGSFEDSDFFIPGTSTGATLSTIEATSGRISLMLQDTPTTIARIRYELGQFQAGQRIKVKFNYLRRPLSSVASRWRLIINGIEQGPSSLFAANVWQTINLEIIVPVSANYAIQFENTQSPVNNARMFIDDIVINRLTSSNLRVETSVKFFDNTTTILNNYTINNISAGLNLFNTSPKNLGLLNLQKEIKNYTVRLYNSDTLLESRKYRLDNNIYKLITTLIWVNKYGSLDSYDFTGIQTRVINRNITQFNKNRRNIPKVTDFINAIKEVETEEQITVNSNVIDENTYNWLKEISNSPNAYIKIGDEYRAIIITGVKADYNSEELTYNISVTYVYSAQQVNISN